MVIYLRWRIGPEDAIPALTHSLLLEVFNATRATSSPHPLSPGFGLQRNRDRSAVEVESIKSNTERLMAPPVTDQEALQLAQDNTAFALDLYQQVVEEDENLFFSPHSISIALAMTFEGARGDTATEMAQTLHYNLPGDALHNAFNALDLALESRGQGASNSEGEPFELEIANALWGQQDFAFEAEFLDALALNYGAGMNIVDFMGATEDARLTINAWVASKTNDRIPELIPDGILTRDTRLVLTNAIYFNAAWKTAFEEADTNQEAFVLSDGSSVDVDMMHLQEDLGFFAGDGFVAVELPYDGEEVSMIALLPDADLATLEAQLDAATLQQLVSGLPTQDMQLSFPKFKFETKVELSEALQALGMVLAFSGPEADFSGISAAVQLYIQAVIHQAFVEVKESGTEAAAATAVVVGEYTSAEPEEPIVVRFDKPFFFMISDRATGAVVFMGRIANPVAE